MKKILISILTIVIATAIQLYFWPYIEPAPSLLYYSVLILCCLYGNGLVAIFLSAVLMQYFFIPPYYSVAMIWPSDYVRQILFIICAMAIKLIVDQMKDSVRKLEEEKKSREHFISTLTHDLRTPLTAAKLKAEIINKVSQDEIVRNNAVRISANLLRADKLIQDILDVSRIKAGQKILMDYKSCDLHQLLTTCIEEQTGIHGDRFVLTVPAGIHMICDKDGIQRIVENLCANAVKYGDQNKIYVEVKSQDHTLLLTVHNTGSYIPKEKREELFDAFKQLESTASGKVGWGRGLSLVKAITEAHGGNVKIESSEALGTTFIVTLPLLPDEKS